MISSGMAKKVVATGVVVLGAGAYLAMARNGCNSNQEAKVSNWCVDNGHGGPAGFCETDGNGDYGFTCADGEYYDVSGLGS